MALENFYSPTDTIRFDQEGLDKLGGEIQENFTTVSPEGSPNRHEYNHPTEDLFVLEGANCEASHGQSWQFVDDNNSSNCLPQVSEYQQDTISPPEGEHEDDRINSKDLQDRGCANLSPLDAGEDGDFHYRRIVSTILRQTKESLEKPRFDCCDNRSGFVTWNEERTVNVYRPLEHQKTLRTILLNVPLMHSIGGSIQTYDSYENRRTEFDKATRIKRRKEGSDNDGTDQPELKGEVSAMEMEVSVRAKEVLITMRCPWRECLLVDIICAINRLGLDAHSVQSSTVDGVLSLTVQSKFQGGAEVASTRMIKEALSRIAGKS